MLEGAPLLTMLDSLAAGANVLKTAFGETGAEVGSISLAANNNVAVLAAYDEVSIQSEVTPVFARRATMMLADKQYQALQGGMLQRALDRYYGVNGFGDLNGFLKSQNVRVHPNLKVIGMQIDSRNLFAPYVVDPVAVYQGSGAGAGIFTAGSAIDTTQYGDTKFEVVVGAMGSSTRTIRITLKRFDESTDTRVVVVPANAEAGAVIDFGDRYVAVTNIVTVSGGGPYDVIRIRSVIERTIAL